MPPAGGDDDQRDEGGSHDVGEGELEDVVDVGFGEVRGPDVLGVRGVADALDEAGSHQRAEAELRGEDGGEDCGDAGAEAVEVEGASIEGERAEEAEEEDVAPAGVREDDAK